MDVEDVDGDELNYFVNTDIQSDASISDGILNIVPMDNYFGDIAITITVSDGVFDVSQSFVLTVIPINDPPIISSVPDQSISEDTELIIDIIVSDPDGDELIFITDNTGNASISITDNQMNLIPAQNFNGEFNVLISVSAVSYTHLTLPTTPYV